MLKTQTMPARQKISTESAAPAAAVYLIDKPEGPTSFRMVQLMRRVLGIKKIGHAGTLDPFASGLLVICVGRGATRHISIFMEGEKEYLADLKLGVETDTYDREGRVIAETSVTGFASDTLHHCLAGFVGEQLQTPPRFSAVKHKGKPLYHYARKGIEVVKEPRRIMIKRLELLHHENDLLTLRIVCSKGTYIRSLAHDIGRTLGCGAHLQRLRRLRSGMFHVDDAVDGEMLVQGGDGAGRKLAEKKLAVEDVLAASVG